MDSAIPGGRRTVSTRGAARHLRATERHLKTTDAAWVRQTFGDIAWPLRRSWLAMTVVLDVIALGLVLFGVLVVLPVAFAGFLLGNVAVCMHLERRLRREGCTKNR
ncbi:MULTISPECIES: DUF3040 domain-containing protein [unclassified Amycolatopsis]|uniref:DUF3040 domain-containing protein n=1 Tax=unclassified Amycolatopsis TaxID=2618356 RepID=UPI001C69EBCD|nr:DUF3040 domain-containing protein [Amycolatopsis sp. DSM 110486]QYN19092.1 DUF3040 domain-containing protein [Amycolatopsis sp. DSM 110486]